MKIDKFIQRWLGPRRNQLHGPITGDLNSRDLGKLVQKEAVSWVYAEDTAMVLLEVDGGLLTLSWKLDWSKEAADSDLVTKAFRHGVIKGEYSELTLNIKYSCVREFEKAVSDPAAIRFKRDDKVFKRAAQKVADRLARIREDEVLFEAEDLAFYKPTEFCSQELAPLCVACVLDKNTITFEGTIDKDYLVCRPFDVVRKKDRTPMRYKQAINRTGTYLIDIDMDLSFGYGACLPEDLYLGKFLPALIKQERPSYNIQALIAFDNFTSHVLLIKYKNENVRLVRCTSTNGANFKTDDFTRFDLFDLVNYKVYPIKGTREEAEQALKTLQLVHNLK